MSNPRLRPLYYAGGALLLVWALVWGGFQWAENAKVTAAKLAKYVNSVNLSKLTGEERAKAIKRLEDMINALSPEERKLWRSEDNRDWFIAMTDEEKGPFLDAVMPSGFKQMLDAFSELPDDKRKKVVEDALRNMRAEATSAGGELNRPPGLTPELEQRVRAIGLKALYTQGSPQTKADLAPLIEAIQHQIQSGRGMR